LRPPRLRLGLWGVFIHLNRLAYTIENKNKAKSGKDKSSLNRRADARPAPTIDHITPL